jgi:hypothetical protein
VRGLIKEISKKSTNISKQPEVDIPHMSISDIHSNEKSQQYSDGPYSDQMELRRKIRRAISFRTSNQMSYFEDQNQDSD